LLTLPQLSIMRNVVVHQRVATHVRSGAQGRDNRCLIVYCLAALCYTR